MSGLSFFSSVTYGNQSISTSQFILEAVDDYFYLGGKKAFVIPNRVLDGKEGVVFSSANSPVLLTALKVVSYFTLIIPLLVLIAKLVLCHNYQFHVIDARTELEKGVDITPAMMEKLKQLMLAIERREDHAEIEWLSKGGVRVFRLAGIPHLIFKIDTKEDAYVYRNNKLMTGSELIVDRFEKMVKGKEVCLANQLNSLVIPQAKLFTLEVYGTTYSVIAEQSLSIEATESVQEELYRTQMNHVGDAIRQLCTFIVETAFDDVTWRNIPIIQEAPGFQGQCRIGLIDLEHAEEARYGILGSGNGSRGLVRCLFSQEQIDAVLAQAREHNLITQEEADQAKVFRMKEIESAIGLHDFHRQNGILENPRKPIVVDVETLGLDLNESAKPHVDYITRVISKKEVLEYTVAEINRLITQTRENESVKGKRSVVISANEGIFLAYDTLGIRPPPFTLETGEKSWLKRVLDALIAKGHIFSQRFRSGDYLIQA